MLNVRGAVTTVAEQKPAGPQTLDSLWNVVLVGTVYVTADQYK